MTHDPDLPAPWTILEFERSIAIRTGASRSLIHVSNVGAELTEANRADARLVAAAPLLLAALRAVADALERGTPDRAALRRARRAIHEATGPGFDMRRFDIARVATAAREALVRLVYGGEVLAEFPDELSFDKDEGRFSGLADITLQERARAALAERTACAPEGEDDDEPR